MPVQHDIPERCSLAQAAIWVWKSINPIPDDIYRAAPLEANYSEFNGRDLAIQLRSGSIRATGKLYIFWEKNSVHHGVGPETENAFISFEDIPNAAWVLKNIDWKNSLLTKVSYPQIAGEVGLKREPEPPFEPSDEYYEFDRIRVSVSDLMKSFPPNASDQAFVATEIDEHKKPKPGAPPSYNWDLIWAEIAVRADLDGLPKSQAECVRWISDWYSNRFNEVPPSESSLKEKLKLVYRHHRKAGN